MSHGYQGPAELLNNTTYWPQDVIIMSLLNVGSNDGANTKLMREFIARTKGFNLIAAGGIRNSDDLFILKDMGIKSALIATALHQKQISTDQLKRLRQ
jgi:phosphoribosylformimino-5-aminoimidazole carboxamide ribotide isomerase